MYIMKYIEDLGEEKMTKEDKIKAYDDCIEIINAKLELHGETLSLNTVSIMKDMIERIKALKKMLND